MKKLFPIRMYFVRARVFGYILLFLAVFYLIYFLIDVLRQ